MMSAILAEYVSDFGTSSVTFIEKISLTETRHQYFDLIWKF